MAMAVRWDHLPPELLGHVFSHLHPAHLARAMLACRHWLACARSHFPSAALRARFPPWLVAMPSRSHGPPPSCCYVRDPEHDRWHALPLDFLPCQLRLVAPVRRIFLLCKLASSSALRLALLNPFARQFERLPALITPRSNPAVGVVVRSDCSFCVIVAGGASGASYEPTVETYDSRRGSWSRTGPMPVEFAVRLTVWTPNESVHAQDGAMYWMTSARAYSVVGFDVERRTWREVKVPMADRLEWAALVRRPGGTLGLVGGTATGDGQGRVWELTDGDEWRVTGAVPPELGSKFWGMNSAPGMTRCVGNEEAVYLFKDLGSDMLLWTRAYNGGGPPSPTASLSSTSDQDGTKKKWEWRLVGGGGGVDASLRSYIPMRAALLCPTLSLWINNNSIPQS